MRHDRATDDPTMAGSPAPEPLLGSARVAGRRAGQRGVGHRDPDPRPAGEAGGGSRRAGPSRRVGLRGGGCRSGMQSPWSGRRSPSARTSPARRGGGLRRPRPCGGMRARHRPGGRARGGPSGGRIGAGLDTPGPRSARRRLAGPTALVRRRDAHLLRVEAQRRGVSIAEVVRDALADHLPGRAGPGPLSFFALGEGSPTDASERVDELLAAAVRRDRRATDG